MTLSRRKLLYSTAAAISAGCTVPARALQDTAGVKSGLVTGVPRPLKYRDVTGFLSENQVRWHQRSLKFSAWRTAKRPEWSWTSSVTPQSWTWAWSMSTMSRLWGWAGSRALPKRNGPL